MAEASCFAPVIGVDSPLLAQPLADSFARAIAAVAYERQFDLVSAASSTFSKDVLPRAAALLGGAHGQRRRPSRADSEAGLQFDCPQYAGAVTATLRLIGSPQVVTVRGVRVSRPRRADESKSQPVERIEIEAAKLATRCQYHGLEIERRVRGRT